MIIQCPGCRTRYHYDEARFSGASSKRIRCTKCTNVFEIRNPAGSPPSPDSAREDAASLNAPVLGVDDFSLESTAMGGGPRRKASTIVPPGVPAIQAPARPTAAPGAGAGGDARRLRLPSGERLSVACISGPDAGKVFPIETPRVVIGRASADVLLTDGECSRQHAAIEVEGEKATLVDLGSTNGTYYGDRRVNQLELDSRMEFDVGATTLMFLRTQALDPQG